MFEKITPEEAGISSALISEFLDLTKKYNAATHGIIMMKGNRIFEEAYWAPFDKDTCHRMYSQTKSLVGIAVMLLLADGLLSPDDRIADFFPDKIDSPVHPWLKEQTVRQTLTMTTVGGSAWWFAEGDPDRVHLYLNRSQVERPAGTVWDYDSPGAQVLSVLVERLSGMPLLDYLKKKLFNRMGNFQTAQMLKTPNGDSWGDSAMVCTLRDMASFGRLLMQNGEWNGEQLIPAELVREATSAQVDNSCSEWKSIHSKGYGYLIWREEGNAFGFVGMGNQVTLCFPDQDLLFSMIADYQGSQIQGEILLRAFYSLVAERIQNEKIPENETAYRKLEAQNASLRLFCLQGKKHSETEREIAGTTYLCEKNKLGMKHFSFTFEEDFGEFSYCNAQGEKTIRFGLNKNEFGHFPQYGYSDEYGTVPTDNGFLYRDAVSAAWMQENRLHLYVQIIDRYLGNLLATFSFRRDEVFCTFSKNAEAFLSEYDGSFMAKKTI